jgi:hypothetical protein
VLILRQLQKRLKCLLICTKVDHLKERSDGKFEWVTWLHKETIANAKQDSVREIKKNSNEAVLTMDLQVALLELVSGLCFRG